MFSILTGYFRNVSKEEELLVALQEELFKNPLAKDLYEQAQKIHIAVEGRPFTIRYGTDDELQSFNAMACFDKYCICLSKAHSFELQLSDLIFELTNFLQVEEKDVVYNRLFDGRYPIRRTVYIKLREKIEFNGCKIHHRIVRHGIKHLDWDPHIDEYKNASKRTFEEDFKTIPENHKEFFGKEWDSVHNPNKRLKESSIF